MQRSKSYRFTFEALPVWSINHFTFEALPNWSWIGLSKDNPWTVKRNRLIELRRLAKLHNAVRKIVEPDKPQNDVRVRVYGRLGRNNPNRHLYGRKRGNCRFRHATRFDVYLQGGYGWKN